MIAESGIRYLIFGFAWGDLSHESALASMKLFAEEVMPRFR